MGMLVTRVMLLAFWDRDRSEVGMCAVDQYRGNKAKLKTPLYPPPHHGVKGVASGVATNASAPDYFPWLLRRLSRDVGRDSVASSVRAVVLRVSVALIRTN